MNFEICSFWLLRAVTVDHNAQNLAMLLFTVFNLQDFQLIFQVPLLCLANEKPNSIEKEQNI